MITRTIPVSGEKLSIVGLESWQQFDVGASVTEKDPLKEVLHKCLKKY